jgi:maltoporin
VLYVDFGNVDGQNFSVWMGKRFYRWSAIDMDDFFSVDMSGPGFGVIGAKSEAGVFSAAVMNTTASREFNTDSAPVVTGIGNAAKTTLHLRWEDLATAFGTWSYWVAGGTTPPTRSAGGTVYSSANGGFLGVKNAHAVFGGKNEIGVAFGQGVMSNLSSQGELVRDCSTLHDVTCNVQDSSRVRAWDGFSWEVDRWTGQVGVIIEDWNKGQNSHVRWTSVGVRPIYWFTEHLSLVTEAGTSIVTDDSDSLGERRLTRFTVAPQMSFGKGNFSRPVFRAFYSRTNWSENNKISAAADAPTFANITDKDSFGVQTEIWF